MPGPRRKRPTPRFETYQARGRPLRAAVAAVEAAAAAPRGPRAPWRTERALNAGGSLLCRASAPRPARTQLHAPCRGRSSPSRAPQLVPRGAAAGRELEVMGSAARPRPDLLPPAAGERGGGEGLKGEGRGREEGADRAPRVYGGRARPRVGVKFPCPLGARDVPGGVGDPVITPAIPAPSGNLPPTLISIPNPAGSVKTAGVNSGTVRTRRALCLALFNSITSPRLSVTVGSLEITVSFLSPALRKEPLPNLPVAALLPHSKPILRRPGHTRSF